MVSRALIEEQFAAAHSKYPKLNQPEKVGEFWIIEGSIDVIDDEGGYWDTYDVRIIINKSYPSALPLIVETGGKIEKSPNWHNTFNCCLSTNAVMFAEMKGEVTLEKWLTNYVHKFLANHVLKVVTGDYAVGEFAHGTEGIIQGYKLIFETNDPHEVLRRLKLMCGVITPGKNQSCFCGGDKKYKRCFELNPDAHYMNIPLHILKKDMIEVSGYLR